MTSQSNIARPYAQALFELAEEQDQLNEWADQLNLLTIVSQDKCLAELAEKPQVSSSQLEQLVFDVCGSHLTDSGKSFVKLLIKNGRLSATNEIAQAFAKRKADAEKVVQANMVTAAKMSSTQQEKFVTALQKKLGRTVNLEFTVDSALLGGAIIRAGDWVIDGSVKSHLKQLVGVLEA